MISNCPFYEKKVSVILINFGDVRLVAHTIPNWLFQIDTNIQLIILDINPRSSAALLSELCKRYHKSFSTQLYSDSDCVYYNNKEFDESVLRGCICNNLAEVICVADIKTVPKAFYMEIALGLLNENTVITTSSSVIFKKPEDILIKSVDNSKMIIDGIIEELNLNQLYKPHLEIGYSSVGKRSAIIMPCMDREKDAIQSIPQWMSQLYSNFQFVFVDYSSKGNIRPFLQEFASSHNLNYCELEYENYNYDADIVVIKVPDMQYFNISHAYNYALTRIKTDIVCTVCADSCPRDYYLEAVMSMVDDKTIVQCWWGLHGITYDNWKELNGHQEFIVGWGGEDDDLRIRATLKGLSIKTTPQRLVYHIPQVLSEKTINRQIPELQLSSHINMTRFLEYQSNYGYCGNYGLTIGQQKPISYKGKELEMLQLSCCIYKEENPVVPSSISKHKNIYYILIDTNDDIEWINYSKWAEYGTPEHHEVLPILNSLEETIKSTLLKFAKNTLGHCNNW